MDWLPIASLIMYFRLNKWWSWTHSHIIFLVLLFFFHMYSSQYIFRYLCFFYLIKSKEYHFLIKLRHIIELQKKKFYNFCAYFCMLKICAENFIIFLQSFLI